MSKFEIDYGRLPRYIFVALVLLALLVLNYCRFTTHIGSNSQLINDYYSGDDEMDKERMPAVAGLFYEADPQALEKSLDLYLGAEAGPRRMSQPHLLIVPHAGYQYSAKVAAKAYKELSQFKDRIRNVILVGPSHRVAFRGIALSPADYFSTPLGKIPLNREINEELSRRPGFRYFEEAHLHEHSLEVQLPFLQKTLSSGFKIVPLVYGAADPAVLAEALAPYLGREDTVIIVSADLSHYLDYEAAQKQDRQTADKVAAALPEVEDHMSCGAVGINAALLLAQKRQLQPEMLDMANSGDAGGEYNAVVGYGSWLFAENQKKPARPLSHLEQEVLNLKSFAVDHGKDLLKIARIALEEAVLHHNRFKPSRADYPDVLFDKGAAFVTLYKNGELRGCIGSLLPNMAVAGDVAANAYAAALEDSRFPPVNADELPQIEVSVSLVSDYERIDFASEEDLLKRLQPGTDGLIIRDGNRQGVFLPVVWQQLPDRRDFLNNLKIKAGMSPSYWSNNIKAYRFRVVEIKTNAD